MAAVRGRCAVSYTHLVLIRLFWENPAGIMQVGNMTSCVTQGAGVWGPAMRVGTDSEVMLLRVKFEG